MQTFDTLDLGKSASDAYIMQFKYRAIQGPAPPKMWRSPRYFGFAKRDILKMGLNKTIIKNDLAFNCVVTLACKNFMLPECIDPIHLNDIFYYKLDIRKSSPGILWESTFKTRDEVMNDPSVWNLIRLF